MGLKKFFRRIRKPWPLGYNDKRLSVEAHRAKKRLSFEDLLLVSRFNPFKGQRDSKIQELYGRGLPQSIIVELSGFPPQTISRIARRQKKHE